MTELSTIVRALAALAQSNKPAPQLDVCADHQPFVWLGTTHTSFLAREAYGRRATSNDFFEMLTTVSGGTDRVRLTSAMGHEMETVHRLAGIDALHRSARLVREGWVFLSGTLEVDGRAVPHMIPIVSHPVRLIPSMGSVAIEIAGDMEISPLVTDPTQARTLEEGAQFGGGALPAPRQGLGSSASFGAPDDLVARLTNLLRWIDATAEAMGLPVAEVRGDATSPLVLRRKAAPGLVAIVGGGLYLAPGAASPALGTVIEQWSDVEGIDRSSLAALYGEIQPPPQRAEPAPVPSTRSLTPAQQEIVRRSRHERLVTVSGAPGNGKSHTVAAVAIDAISRGESVLVATQTDHAADVVAGMFLHQPGPTPIVFGDAERRAAIAAELAGGVSDSPADHEHQRTLHASEEAAERVAWLERTIANRLGLESLASAAFGPSSASDLYVTSAAGLFDPDVDLDQAEERFRVAGEHGGFFARRRSRRAESALRALARVDASMPLADIGRALQHARARRVAISLVTDGGTTIGSAWGELARADEEYRLAFGAEVSDRVHRQATRSAKQRRAVVALAHALRSGRAWRRMELQRFDSGALLDALPLWVGTLRDIEDLLPATPAMFDLVILDEASQIDQPRAVPALVRAKRAVVVGDPHQLRHVSFVSDAEVTAVLSRYGLLNESDRLDIRRNSIFDVSASAAPVSSLREHFRSVPHLIGFSSAKFYRGELVVATRHPRNEHTDAIDIVRVSGERAANGVNMAEVEAVRRRVRALDEQGVVDIGVLSPFRAQADALERMLLDEFSVEEIDRLRLRVGTVHSFQGAERDVVVISLALDPSSVGARRFVEDPNLFNVMITRARQRAVVVTSLGEETGGLIAEYLIYADHPPPPVSDGPTCSAYAREVERELQRAGLQVRSDYPVGRFEIDLCVGVGDSAVGVECGVHPDGPSAHIERHRQLVRAGWKVVDLFPTRFDNDPLLAALSLSVDLARNVDPDR